MAQKTKAANPGTIYITFGLVAAVSLIMSTFIGTGLAIWYPSLDKPELTLALPFTFMIRIFLAVMFGFLLYYTYGCAETIREKWYGFFYSFHVFFLNELFYVLFFSLKSPLFYFITECVLAIASIGLFIFLIQYNRKAIWCFVPYLLWLCYQIPWTFTLWQLNA